MSWEFVIQKAQMTLIQYHNQSTTKYMRLMMGKKKNQKTDISSHQTQRDITRTRLYNFEPLKPHFYIVKLGVYRGIHYYSYFC